MAKKPKAANSNKKKPKKRGKKFRRVFDMELAYKIINIVQSNDEQYKIRVMSLELAPIIENLIKDASLKFEKSVEDGSIIYVILPGDVRFSREVEVEELEDEFLEKGQLF